MNIALPGKAAAFMASQREQAEALRNQHGIEARPWYRITNAADSDEAEVMLYDEVGGWWGATADEFIADLRGITAPNIRLRVNSPGGSVFEGVAIANALRSHPANVTVQVDGIAASIASVICMAGDRVEMCPNTMLMIHDASGLCIGNAADMAEMEELLSLISDNIADAYVAKAGGTRAEWRARMQAETWYLPDDAVKAGLADEATKTPKSGTPAEEPDEDEPEQGEPEPEMRRTFDPKAYGYHGPQQPEGPKPTPPAAPQTDQVTLTFNLGESFGQEFVEMARKLVAKRGEPLASAEPEPVVEPAPEPVTAPEVVDTASPVHHTATEDRPWDAGPNEKRLPSPMTLATAKKMYAWYDESQVEDGELPKSAAKLPHHEVSADGTPGAANLSGVRNALARLPQSDIPASQHDAVRRHLQAHLDDANKTDDATDVEPEAAATEPAPVDEPADPNAEWAAAVARLTEPRPDPWAEAFSHLVNPQPSSSAATAAA
jgi:ATP-dependent protease ClpP protease subunit